MNYSFNFFNLTTFENLFEVTLKYNIFNQSLLKSLLLKLTQISLKMKRFANFFLLRQIYSN